MEGIMNVHMKAFNGLEEKGELGKQTLLEF